MRGNSIRSFVTRNGQVIRVRANRVRREPPNARTGARGPGTQRERRPAGPAPAGGGMDLPKLGALVLLGFACLFVVMLVAVGTYRAGKWVFSGREDSPSEVRVESSRGDTRTMAPQKPVAGIPSASHGRGEVHEESHDSPIDQQAQARSEMVTYGRQPQREKEVAPIVSREPVVDYVSSVREMESVMEARSKEIKRIIEDLRNIRRSGENDW